MFRDLIIFLGIWVVVLIIIFIFFIGMALIGMIFGEMGKKFGIMGNFFLIWWSRKFMIIFGCIGRCFFFCIMLLICCIIFCRLNCSGGNIMWICYCFGKNMLYLLVWLMRVWAVWWISWIVMGFGKILLLFYSLIMGIVLKFVFLGVGGMWAFIVVVSFFYLK